MDSTSFRYVNPQTFFEEPYFFYHPAPSSDFMVSTGPSSSRESLLDQPVQRDWSYAPSGKLEAALTRASQKAMQYEHQMKELEVQLSEGLSNFRAIDSFIQESHNSIQRNAKRAERACQTQIPHINDELDESFQVLSDLADTLPTIQTQLTNVRVVYDSGRQKAKTLVSELRWLNTEFYERWRRIIFSSSSPVSWRWKAIMRGLFTFTFVIGAYLFWLLLMGAYRAHRHRLVWGDKLMS